MGESLLFLDGLYDSINNAVELKSNNNKQLEIKAKGFISKDNLKEVYEDCFKLIMKRILNNSVFNKEKGKKINLDLINFINNIENNTEGFANKDSKKLSELLLKLSNDTQLQSIGSSNIQNKLESIIKQYKKEIDYLVEQEIKSKETQLNPEFILLLDTSENMENNYQNFVRKIIYEVLVKLNYTEKDKITIYTFNSEYSSNTKMPLKNLKKFNCVCEEGICFSKALKDCLEEICQFKDKRYYLLSVFSGNICDKDKIRNIAFKSIGLSSKIFLKSRVVSFITKNTSFENDDITYGLLQQISSGDSKVHKPVEIKCDESDEVKVQKILNSFI